MQTDFNDSEVIDRRAFFPLGAALPAGCPGLGPGAAVADAGANTVV
jgi:hypothetical protein